MSEFTKKLLSIGAIVGVGAFVFFVCPELLPATAFLTETLDEYDILTRF